MLGALTHAWIVMQPGRNNEPASAVVSSDAVICGGLASCVIDFAEWPGYPPIAVLSLNPGIYAMCQTLHSALIRKTATFLAR
jgi:hypothetical protein